MARVIESDEKKLDASSVSMNGLPTDCHLISRHRNGEKFWGYLKRKLVSKGGIRKEKLPLYLAEYVWIYNHRHFTIKQQINEILNLLHKYKFNQI
ncbi:MAG: hypothetical protein ABID79_03960 [Elusimicrobiota bacterium]